MPQPRSPNKSRLAIFTTALLGYTTVLLGYTTMGYFYDQPGSDKRGLVSTDRTNVGELGTIRRFLSET